MADTVLSSEAADDVVSLHHLHDHVRVSRGATCRPLSQGPTSTCTCTCWRAQLGSDPTRNPQPSESLTLRTLE